METQQQMINDEDQQNSVCDLTPMGRGNFCDGFIGQTSAPRLTETYPVKVDVTAPSETLPLENVQK